MVKYVYRDDEQLGEWSKPFDKISDLLSSAAKESNPKVWVGELCKPDVSKFIYQHMIEDFINEIVDQAGSAELTPDSYYEEWLKCDQVVKDLKQVVVNFINTRWTPKFYMVENIRRMDTGLYDDEELYT